MQVVMRRGAFYSPKKWGSNCPSAPLPSLTPLRQISKEINFFGISGYRETNQSQGGILSKGFYLAKIIQPCSHQALSVITVTSGNRVKEVQYVFESLTLFLICISDCGKQAKDRFGSSGISLSTGPESSIFKVRFIVKCKNCIYVFSNFVCKMIF